MSLSQGDILTWSQKGDILIERKGDIITERLHGRRLWLTPRVSHVKLNGCVNLALVCPGEGRLFAPIPQATNVKDLMRKPEPREEIGLPCQVFQIMRIVVRMLSILWILSVLDEAGMLKALAQENTPSITTPGPGDALQGVVTITGTTQVEGFASAEIAFAYSGDSTGTWFRISSADQAVEAGTLAIWDTTSISDGVYDLRLQVLTTDGKTLQAIISGLRVRNYTPVETPTPTQVIPAATPLPTNTSTPTPYPTPSSLPPNPAVLSTQDVSLGVGYGGLAAVVIFILLGLYLMRRRR